jgi:hypothetical protein
VFTSGENFELAVADGSIDVLEHAGAVILKDTCPEVTPYNRSKYNHLLTNSLKAEHYLTSGLNRLPTSVLSIEDCVAHAFDASLSAGDTQATKPFRLVQRHLSVKGFSVKQPFPFVGKPW